MNCNITDKDIGDIFHILTHCTEHDLKIEKLSAINDKINKENPINHSNYNCCDIFPFLSWLCL